MIHRFRVQNFKSIGDLTVDLSPVTVLVGRSGTGKTNFVEALRFLRDVLSSQNAIHNAQQKWKQIRPATGPEGHTRLEVDFSIAGIEDKFQYGICIRKEGPNIPVQAEWLNLGNKCLFHQEQAQGTRTGHQLEWVVEPELLQVPKPGPIALGRIPAISEVVIAFTALTTGIGWYSFSDSVLGGGRTNHPMAGLDDEATNYLETLRDIVSNLQDLFVRKSIVASLQSVNPSVSSIELNSIQDPTHVVVGHKFEGKTLELQLSQESAGFRRFYAHLLALYQRPPKQTLVFEHPEDGIHPAALSLLADEFKSAAQKGRGQVILTTHSPKLLDQFDVEAIRVVEMDGLQTRIGVVSDKQKEAVQEDLMDTGELLTVDPARIQPETAAVE